MAVESVETRERRAAQILRWSSQVQAYRDAVRRYQEGVARYHAHGGRRRDRLASTSAPAAVPLGDERAPEPVAAPPAALPAADVGAWAPLSRRERDVAALVARGLTNRQIGEALVVEEGTVANHVRRIRMRLGFDSRSCVAAWVAWDERRRGFVPNRGPVGSGAG
ncbi:MAG TPA: helix-turn-helix transcriptional regulator [Chloroflexota bacterium]|jgi:non-specific serine/threonine protein kinase